MKTFLKWAGNKTSVVPKIIPYFKGTTLIEPFAGSCAVTLNTDFELYYCNDINQDLINTYLLIQKDTNAFIKDVKAFFDNGNTSEKFYELREKYNQTKDLDEKAKLFIYLNRHCFNGLCRYNKSGKFNVPFGKYSNPYFPEKEIKEFASNSHKIIFSNDSFKNVFHFADNNTTIYCDPPYSALTDTSNFSNYTGLDFKHSDHVSLRDLCKQTVESTGCTAIISNHDTDETRQLYNDASEIISFEVKRTISRNAENRKPASELIAIYRST